MNDQARAVLKNHPQIKDHIFVRDCGFPFTNVINKCVWIIKKAAGLPEDFRPLHGPRHVYASAQGLILEDVTHSENTLKAFQENEEGKGLMVCKDADDMLKKLGV